MPSTGCMAAATDQARRNSYLVSDARAVVGMAIAFGVLFFVTLFVQQLWALPRSGGSGVHALRSSAALLVVPTSRAAQIVPRIDAVATHSRPAADRRSRRQRGRLVLAGMVVVGMIRARHK